jgi:hypothetical protein
MTKNDLLNGGLKLLAVPAHGLDRESAGELQKGLALDASRCVTHRRQTIRRPIISCHPRCAPFAKCEFDLIYNQGISLAGEILDAAVDKNLVDKSGAWYSCNGERIGQGRESAITYMKENPKLMNDLRLQIMEKAGILKNAEGKLETAANMGATATPEDKPAKTEEKPAKRKH